LRERNARKHQAVEEDDRILVLAEEAYLLNKKK